VSIHAVGAMRRIVEVSVQKRIMAGFRLSVGNSANGDYKHRRAYLARVAHLKEKEMRVLTALSSERRWVPNCAEFQTARSPIMREVPNDV
jgi:hypothetical protein